MSSTEHGSGPDDQARSGVPDTTGKAIRPPDVAAERAARRREHDKRLRILRGKADLAHSEAAAIAARHIDPDQLEELLTNATPTEAERIHISERRIALRAAEARALAEAAEAAYEEAALEGFDEDLM